jgi:hypothetical protein
MCAMLRLVGFGLAAGVLIAACALAEPPPPAGTVTVQIEVANKSLRDVPLAVSIEGRPLPGSARPPVLAAGTTADVVFYVPIATGWNLSVNHEEFLPDLRGRTGEIVDIGIEVDVQGNVGWWCSGNNC